MNEENTEYLLEQYPKLFPKNEIDNPMKSLMSYGFSCKDGWFELINTLCSQIQWHIDHDDKAVQISVQQVKEKFGGLRFYVNMYDKVIQGMINYAEAHSYYICEECGNKGEIQTDTPWVITRCNDCNQRKLNELTEKQKKILNSPENKKKAKLRKKALTG